MTKVLLCCLLLPLSWGSAPVQKATKGSTPASSQNVLAKDSAFYSAALQRDMHYRVLLPRNYAQGGRFPVLYLLHGLYGDYLNWDTRTGLENYARNLSLLIAIPDPGAAGSTGSPSVPGGRCAD